MNLKHHQFDEMEWTSVEDIPNNMVPCIKIGIESYINGEKFQSYGEE